MRITKRTDKLLAIILVLAGVTGIVLSISIFIFSKTKGISGQILFIKYKLGDPVRPVFRSLYLIIAGLIILNGLKSLHIGTKKLFYITLSYFSIFFSLKLIQYYTFNTYGFDLGIFTGIMKNLTSGKGLWDSINSTHGFSGHFSPILYLLYPFYYIHKSPVTLLFLQTAAITATIPVLYLMADNEEYFVPVLSLFFMSQYIQGLHMFDFHPEAMSLPFALLSLYLIKKDKILLSAVLLIFIMLFKEDAALFSVGAGFYMLFRKKYIQGSLMIILSLVYAYFAVFHIIPHYSGLVVNTLLFSRYNYLSAASHGTIQGIIARPGIFIQELIRPERLKSLTTLFASFGFAPLLAPIESFASLPPLLLHILSSYKNQYNFATQYATFIIPGMLFGFYYGMKKIKSGWMLTVSLICVFYFAWNNVPGYLGFNNFGRLKTIRKAISDIPQDVAVAANNNFIPNLIVKNDARLLSDYASCEYVVIDTTQDIFLYKLPKKKQIFMSLFQTILSDTSFSTTFHKSSIWVLKRNG